MGAGSYLAGLPAGAKGPGAEPFVTADFKGPIPTNDWCSSLYWERFSEAHYAHPLAMKAGPRGLRVFYPGPEITATKDGILGAMPAAGEADLTIGHAAAAEFAEKRVARASDWFVDVRWERGPTRMTLSYGHGSPFVFGAFEGGGARMAFGQTPRVWAGDAKAGAIGVTVGGKHYGLFAPPGAAWSGVGTREWTNNLAGVGRVAVAVLPEATKDALDLFDKYARFPVVGSIATWAYDPKTADVTGKFEFRSSDAARQNSAGGTLAALYPHQWRSCDLKPSRYAYASVRGAMKLAELGPDRDGSFSTKAAFPGVLPALPRVAGGADAARVAEYLRRDMRADDAGVHDTYWEGKRLGKWASLIPIAEQYGLEAEAAELTKRVKGRLEEWLTATDAAGRPKGARVFAYEKRWGTLIGYPAAFGSDGELNDHHFHYGYFLRAAGEVARRDPAWAADGRWGGMLKLIARDVASANRDDPMFPFLRNFDPYAGHSWASGHGRFGDGNNQESSSEAMNAWYGLILLGQFTGDEKTRDLGAWLYTTELSAIEEYWFDVTGQNVPTAYPHPVITMVWGGKGANGTWFSAEPEAIHAINFLPVTGGSLYLGRYPEYVERNWQGLFKARGGGRLRQWQDVLLMHRALNDPADALRRFDEIAPRLRPEDGNSLAGTYHWIATLNALGHVDRSVTADYPLASTFTKDGRRTHVAYRPKADAGRAVTFSDGTTIAAGSEGFVVK